MSQFFIPICHQGTFYQLFIAISYKLLGIFNRDRPQSKMAQCQVYRTFQSINRVHQCSVQIKYTAFIHDDHTFLLSAVSIFVEIVSG